MTRAEAKKQILGVLLGELVNDDEALFGPEVDEGTPLWETYEAARKELVIEFTRRTS